MPEERERRIEKKGVNASCLWKNAQKCEVAENAEVSGFLGWPRVWWDAVRLADSGVPNTKKNIA